MKPTALIILDGFGIAPPSDANAIWTANTPFIDSLINTYPAHLLHASGVEVGLPKGEVGNSEVGHLTIGSGILRYQSLPRIDKSIESGDFFENEKLADVKAHLKSTKGKLHVLGLIGNGGVHSHGRHLEALLQWSRKNKLHKKTFIHAFLDGRDTKKDLGAQFMQELLTTCKKQKIAGIASVCGRKLAMDRNNNWDRIQKAYNSIALGSSEHTHQDPLEAIQDFYAQEMFDEELEPVVITDKKGNSVATFENGDAVIFFNFRADRARELTQAIVDPTFDKFERTLTPNLHVLTFTEYSKELPVNIIFKPELVTNPIAKVVSDAGLKQLHIAETEKYAHVTFFMNGMIEKPFPGEDRELIPSPSVASYDEKPEMSAAEVTSKIIESLDSKKHDFYIINFANPDMVGHTGNLEASRKAVEAADSSLKQVIDKIVELGGNAFVVGDHGNAEELLHPVTGRVDKEHNNYPVPLFIIGEQYKELRNPDVTPENLHLQPPIGILADVAPTVLQSAGLPIPEEMTGAPLI
ncbi:2,3-bisphosphoglycerate-independent phosphoglycerate mutase [Candidatus Uhrbacteria bacterium]|jgi:2,3-bisphosphoglycerate-independent phosphoglycerate mutase|nr:2,3-bisphosphoglycerate-independent phosphoglycerate mutase [Candidatus Uhrbacteria bacterium]MBT7717637.1 2,3-bisphosphoglycerate-independent phosphoglycerate mutase [Candidatus Uhrbacteria bacterium]